MKEKKIKVLSQKEFFRLIREGLGVSKIKNLFEHLDHQWEIEYE